MLENMFIGRPPGNYDRLLDCQPRGDRLAVFRAVGDFLDAMTPEPPDWERSPTRRDQ